MQRPPGQNKHVLFLLFFLLFMQFIYFVMNCLSKIIYSHHRYQSIRNSVVISCCLQSQIFLIR